MYRDVTLQTPKVAKNNLFCPPCIIISSWKCNLNKKDFLVRKDDHFFYLLGLHP